MRHIDLIVIHCSATRSNQNFPVTALIPLSRGKVRIHGLPLLHHPQRQDLPDTPRTVGGRPRRRLQSALARHLLRRGPRRARQCRRHPHTEAETRPAAPAPSPKESPSRCPHPRPSRPPQRPQGLPLLRLFGVFKSLTLGAASPSEAPPSMSRSASETRRLPKQEPSNIYPTFGGQGPKSSCPLSILKKYRYVILSTLIAMIQISFGGALQSRVQLSGFTSIDNCTLTHGISCR